ncbi:MULTISPECIES: hypothetical protein [Wolbachia]|uniref:Uncharacterized protein n=1 Tax=Wolbachia pipientis TaxID=955 RepID=A0A7G5CE25_WOLPI|nr:MULTISPECIES: hypothetical protein [Wolbachia]QMV47459.1 hypothetical protein HC356_05770 [Wolbachia pipientis]
MNIVIEDIDDDVIPACDAGIQFFMQFHQKCCIVCSFIIKFSGSQCQALG